MENNLKELRNKIIEANNAYRTGEAIISDSEYDDLIEDLIILNPNDELLNKIGIKITEESRKKELPVKMASMNKIKTIEEYNEWLRLKKIPDNTDIICTPKFDGLSLCVDENNKEALTRGDGKVGQLATEHFKLMEKNFNKNNFISIGEVIMKKSVFEKKYSKEYKNPRNLVAGKMNDKNPSTILNDLTYIRYGLERHKENLNKDEQLEFLNSINSTKVKYKKFKVKDITVDILKGLFNEWGNEFELDGIILEVNDYNLREKLGRETSTENPCYARAFKGNFEEVKESIVENITWQVSKNGSMKPVVQIKPIELNGVTVSNVTAINARFVLGYNLKVGSLVKVARSGMVIPILKSINNYEVNRDKRGNYNFILNNDLNDKPINNCPICNSNLEWNKNHIELMCYNENCQGSGLQRIIAFFEILEIDGVSDGLCEIFYDAGHDSVEKILNMSKSDMLKLEGFADRKAEKTFDAIHSKLKNVSLSKLQHASMCFSGLGSKKLELLEDFNENVRLEDIVKIEGFSDISAKIYLDGIVKFKDFIKNLPIEIKKTEKIVAKSNDLQGQVYVFTGVRNKEFESIIQERGGKIASGVSKNVTVLVMKEKGSGTEKEKKAMDFGIRIVTIEELEKELR